MKTIISARVLAILCTVASTITQVYSRDAVFSQSIDSTPSDRFSMNVVMVEFEAKPAGNGNQLRWSTILETNLSHYEIERSISNQPFKKIGTVKAAGSGSLSVEYTFTDNAPIKGTNVYRIRMVDTRGGSRLSEHKLVNGNAQALVSQASRAYPNPARRGTQVRMMVPETGVYAVRLISLQGQVVVQAAMDNTHGDGLGIQVPQDVPAGVYILHAFSEETQSLHQHKVIIQ
jgi:hypothetical protein